MALLSVRPAGCNRISKTIRVQWNAPFSDLAAPSWEWMRSNQSADRRLGAPKSSHLGSGRCGPGCRAYPLGQLINYSLDPPRWAANVCASSSLARLCVRPGNKEGALTSCGDPRVYRHFLRLPLSKYCQFHWLSAFQLFLTATAYPLICMA